MRDLDDAQRPATGSEMAELAQWSSWGAVPEVFDLGKPEWEPQRQQLHAALSDDEYQAAALTTLNAHFTSPSYVTAIWGALNDLGFDGGTVLEPGCGTGTFIGLAPENTTMLGVELDPMTARIASRLYPSADIRNESFADTRLPARSLDAVVGNVPFSSIRLADPIGNRGNHSMHNHFIIKSLAATRPGGVVAVMSSHFTMDSTNPAARREINEMADLLGAVRLPTGAHRRTAGTEAVTDVIVLRRREPGTPPASTIWETTGPRKFGDAIKRINNYFIDNPDMVLGELSIGHGMYGNDTLLVANSELSSVSNKLREALATITTQAHANELGYSPATGQRLDLATVSSREHAPDIGHIQASPDGGFTIVNAEGQTEPYPIPKTQHAEAHALLELRDGIRDLIAAQLAEPDDTTELSSMREQLNDGYRRYADTYGPINRYTVTDTIRTDKKTGETIHSSTRRYPPVMAKLRSDPFYPQVMALENFDQNTLTATPAAILTTRTSYPRRATLGAETASEALAVCMDTYGDVDLEQIATLLGVEDDVARQQLGTLVYDDPAQGRLVSAAEYLSGNVRIKLDEALDAAATDSRYDTNVGALREVQPRWLGSDEIRVSMGASWIPTDTHRQFLAELLNDSSIIVEHPGGSTWDVKGSRHSVAATAVWGTSRRPAPMLAKSVLEQSPIRVYDKIDDKSYLNEIETLAAQEKAQQIQERFTEWVWEDPARARELEASYNTMFNSMVPRDYTSAGEALTLPGLVADFTPLPHQRTAVARMINEPSVGLFHQVGAGKTAEMVMGATELKRMGLVSKPAIVVPNHMLEQFSREYLQLYPGARILAAGKEHLQANRRREFVARITANDWDAVIMTRTAFAKLPLSLEAQRDYLQRQADTLQATLDAAQATGTGLSTKRLQAKLEAFKVKIEKQLGDAADKDPGVTFEQTGIDYLLIDEAHDYKNLMTASNIQAAQVEGSARAADLHMKLDHLRVQHGGRVATLATATPVANSMSESHIMLRYLRPDLLEAAGVADFDSFASTFTRVRPRMEIDATGKFRMAERFDQFINVPELQRLWNIAADVKTEKDLNLPTPPIAVNSEGQRAPQIVLVPSSPEQADYMADIAERNERIKNKAVSLEEDNMLKLSRNAQSAALDIRLVDSSSVPSSPTKADYAADSIHRIWLDTRDRVYLDRKSGEPLPTPGALQLVFCDLSTPSDQKWDFYTELRDQLVDRGMPREQIRFIHEAVKDSQKAALFADCRNGHVAVLIGSTQKMGTGTNVQDRMVWIHEIDAPWRPADVTQRRGRGVRQGNLNDEIGLSVYVTEASFDAYSWQTLERKSGFINTLSHATPDMREVEDVGEDTLSYAQVKAVTSGDPLILEKAEADSQLAMLEKAERAYHRKVGLLESQIADDLRTIGKAEDDLPALDAAVQRTHSPAPDADSWRAKFNGDVATSRTQAAALLDRWAQENVRPWDRTETPLGEVGQLRGHTIVATQLPRYDARGGPSVEFTFADVPARRASVVVDLEMLRSASIGTITKLENKLDALPATIARVSNERDDATRRIGEAEAAKAEPFDTSKLTAARSRCEQINRQMEAKAAELAAPTATVDNTGSTGDDPALGPIDLSDASKPSPLVSPDATTAQPHTRTNRQSNS